MWEMETVTTPKARKEYHCEASDWIVNSGATEDDFDPEDWATIEKARAEGFKIKKGARYYQVSGKWDGEFNVFRARADLNEICQKYDMYDI